MLERSVPALVVLVGGASRRMGTDKAVLAVDGVPAALRVARVVATACGVPVGEVVLVGGPGLWAVELGLGHLPDDTPGAGPLAAIDTALRHLDGDCLVVACDLLGVDVSTIAAIRDGGEVPGCDVAVAVGPDGRRQPLAARWNASAAPAVSAAVGAGERSPIRLLRSLAVVEVAVDGLSVTNVNSPAELADFLGADPHQSGVTDLTGESEDHVPS